MKRRTMTIPLAMLLILVMALSACSQGAVEGTATPAGTKSSTSIPAQTDEPEAKWALPYEGEEVRLTLLGWESYSQIDSLNKFGQWYQEQLGNLYVDFEIPSEDTGTLIEMYLASGDMPDILLDRNAQSFKNSYNDGSRTLNLFDYAEYMPEYFARRESYPHLSWYDVDTTTGYLFFPCWYDAPSEVWFQNQELMDEYDLETPTNYEEMKACMETVHSADSNIDGMSIICWGFGYSYMCFSRLFGNLSGSWSPSNLMYDYDTETWGYSLYDYEEIYRQTTEALAEAYAEGWINPDFITWDGSVFDTKRYKGEWLFTFLYNNISQNSYDSDYDCTPVYIDPPAAEGTTPSVRTDFTSDSTGWAFVVSNATEYPELCCSYLELISSESYADVFFWGWEGETYEAAADGSRSFLDAYLSLDPDDAKSTYGIQVSYAIQPFASQFYAGNALSALFCEESKRGLEICSEKLNSGEYATYYSPNTPLFDDATKEEINSVTSSVGTYVEENLINFVLGNKPMSEWDAFIDGIADYGDMNWVVEQYNSAEQGPTRASQFEREYLLP